MVRLLLKICISSNRYEQICLDFRSSLKNIENSRIVRIIDIKIIIENAVSYFVIANILEILENL